MVSGMDKNLRNLRLAWDIGPEGRECESTEKMIQGASTPWGGDTRRGKLRRAHESEAAGEDTGSRGLSLADPGRLSWGTGCVVHSLFGNRGSW